MFVFLVDSGKKKKKKNKNQIEVADETAGKICVIVNNHICIIIHINLCDLNYIINIKKLFFRTCCWSDIRKEKEKKESLDE